MRLSLKNIFAVALIFLLASCDFRVVRDYKELVYHFIAEPSTLNPVTSSDAYASTVEGLIFDTLLERDNSTLEFVPRVAKRWEVSGDHLQFIFYLRDDVYWHDGVKMTADDVIFSYDRIQDPKVDAAPLRGYFRDVTKAEKIDDYTVRFTYKFPYYKALIMLGGLPVVPRHVFTGGGDFNKSPFGRAPVGNGPFKFKEWKTGQQIVIVKNEDYWGKVPETEGIVFKVVTDINVALQVLKKGEIDMASLTPMNWVLQTNSKNFDRRFDKYKYFTPGYSYIGWNEERPYFKDRRVRRAMTMMVNREKMKKALYYDLVEIVTGPFYKFGPDYDHSIEIIPYDPEGAKKFLDEADWIDHDGDGIRDKDGVPFRFTFMTAGSRTSERITNMLREDLSKIGIEMEITKFEWSVFGKNLQDHAFDATMLGWTAPLEDDPYQVWHSSQIEGGSNYVSFRNEEADHIIEEARREFDADARHKLYRRLHMILHEEQPYTFMFMPASLVAVQKRFTNVNVYKLGLDIREWKVERPEMPLYQ